MTEHPVPPAPDAAPPADAHENPTPAPSDPDAHEDAYTDPDPDEVVVDAPGVSLTAAELDAALAEHDGDPAAAAAALFAGPLAAAIAAAHPGPAPAPDPDKDPHEDEDDFTVPTPEDIAAGGAEAALLAARTVSTDTDWGAALHLPKTTEATFYGVGCRQTTGPLPSKPTPTVLLILDGPGELTMWPPIGEGITSRATDGEVRWIPADYEWGLSASGRTPMRAVAFTVT